MRIESFHQTFLSLNQEKMQRKKFIKTCGGACFGFLAFGMLPTGCGTSKIFSAPVEGSSLVIPLSEFEQEKKGQMEYRNYLIAQNSRLAFPIYIYRKTSNNFTALVMSCTHQGTELQAFGDRLQCPAHGSDFDKNGKVLNGPAIEDLRNLPIKIEGNNLKISLA